MTNSLTEKDPIGLAIWDYHRGKTDAQITVHCNGIDDDIIPVYFLFRTLEQMPELEKQALDQCKGHVLDVGACTGCHTLELQNRGIEVTAVDISSGAIELMQERGVKQVIEEDVFLMKGQQYDTLLMLMNGIGIVGDLNGLQQFLEHAKTLLRPGGQILLESSDIIYLYTEEDGSVYIDLNAEYYGVLDYSMEYNNIKGEEFKWLFVDAELLQDYAEQAGYQFEVIYEDGEDRYLARLTWPV